MKTFVNTVVASALLLLTHLLHAETADLPPTAEVIAALAAHPQVRAAIAGWHAGKAQESGLVAGPHEFAVRLSTQSRRDHSVDQRYLEHELGIERTLRLPRKAALDADLGKAQVRAAYHAVGEALHATSRELLARWFAWQREAAAVTEWQTQVTILRELHAAAVKKVSAGEAARLETMLSAAQLKQAEAQLAQAQTRLEWAEAEWRAQFPTITLPAQPLLGPPQAIDAAPEAQTEWQRRILAENHELARARSETERARLMAARADAERSPDPTVGLSVGSARDGQERFIGVHLSIPLAGKARDATSRSARAEADAAAAREALVLARAKAEARQTIATAVAHYEQWRRLDDVARRMEENARLVEKAWRLGEGQYSDLQLARRQASEARLAAIQAKIDAIEARYRLLLDAHELWDFGPERLLATDPNAASNQP